MSGNNKISFSLLGVFIFLGLSALGYFLSTAALEYKMFERSVTVKGLSDREYQADIVLWPIAFTVANNDLKELYNSLEEQSEKIQKFLKTNGLTKEEISLSTPVITDKIAQNYGNRHNIEFRYSGSQTVTVYSKNINKVRTIMNALSDLGKEGIVFGGDNYRTQTEYLFTRLNEVKPEMIEEATTKAREVAQKFAADSQSKLGKIKRASQGRFSIGERDKNSPHIKKIRVVSTVEYYLSD